MSAMGQQDVARQGWRLLAAIAASAQGQSPQATHWSACSVTCLPYA